MNSAQKPCGRGLNRPPRTLIGLNTPLVAHQRYFRMTVGDFDELLALVSDTIRKQTTNMRDPIFPGERRAVRLRFLAAGGSMKSVAESYRIGYATIRKIIPEVCEAIWSEVGPTVLAFTTPSEWRKMAIGKISRPSGNFQTAWAPWMANMSWSKSRQTLEVSIIITKVSTVLSSWR